MTREEEMNTTNSISLFHIFNNNTCNYSEIMDFSFYVKFHTSVHFRCNIITVI